MTHSVDLIIPVLDEAHVLEDSVARLRRHLASDIPYRWSIVIVDNGSVDGTGEVAKKLAARHADVRYFFLEERGRGRALRHAWETSGAEVCCYTDVDLSTDIGYLRPLIDAILVEGYDVASGSRLLPGSRTKRSLRRGLISRLYNLFVRAALGTKFSDAQCGFKAVNRRVVEKLLPRIQDQGWFFDTELLVLAEKSGYRIKEFPVKWDEDDDSRVKIIPTAWQNIKGVLRLRESLSALKTS